MPFPGAFYKGLNGERRRGSKVVSKGGQGPLVSGRICLRIFLYIFYPFFFFLVFSCPLLSLFANNCHGKKDDNGDNNITRVTGHQSSFALTWPRGQAVSRCLPAVT